MAEKLGFISTWKRRFGHAGLTAASSFTSGAGSAGLITGASVLEASNAVQSGLLSNAVSNLPIASTLKESLRLGLSALAETFKQNPIIPILPIATAGLLWGGGAVAGWQGVKHGPENLKLLYAVLKILEPIAWIVAPVAGLIATLANLGVTAYGMKYRK